MDRRVLLRSLLPPAALAAVWLSSGYILSRPATLGAQADGSYLVSTGQRIVAGTIKFRGRPSDLAMRPQGDLFAVLAKSSVFLANPAGVIEGTKIAFDGNAGFRGIAWTPDGTRLIVTTDAGNLQSFDYDGTKLTLGPKIEIRSGEKNPVPGGLCITRDGKSMFVTAVDLNQVVEVDLATNQVARRWPTEMLPFEVRLSEDERSLIVSNWGGRIPVASDLTAKTEDDATKIVVDSRGAPASGTLCLIERSSGATRKVDVGIHPTSIVTRGTTAWVANTMSDSLSEIDLAAGKVTATIPIRWGRMRVIGAMPDALALHGDRLLVCNGGDNALAEVDLKTRKVTGFRPAGYFPIAIAALGDRAFVLNSKGNGSVANTAYGRAGNAHDFEGTVSIIDLNRDLKTDTAVVAANNSWEAVPSRPKIPVYNGAIKHVLYIIKENRTYDEIYGDLPEGNGDPKLCSLGERVMPNHRALAKEFTLFDNAYVSGTNSADGHAWSTQSLANDYLEHFYVGYSRTYPDDGDCAMSISTGGCLWDTAAKRKKSIRVYGEFCDDALAEYKPYRPKDWFEAWEDRIKGTKKFTYVAHTRVAGLAPYINPNVHYWPLIQSDQARADEFIREYTEYSRKDKVPNLMVMSLCCDHSEGTDPAYPSPRAMMADNDLALGRVVEAISKSPQWKNTAIFVIEDDAQSGPDHVDGHRTPYLVISPYNRRHTVDSNMYTTTNMIRSIEMMLGLDPMNRFDALAKPIDTCFQDSADLTPYVAKTNNVPLDEPNPGRKTAMTKDQRYWAMRTKALDWSHIDGPDSYWLNRIIWASVHPDGRPYPARPGEMPGETEDLD